VKETEPTHRGVRFDLVGFLLVAAFLGALEVALDRGQEDDWFGSNFIITSQSFPASRSCFSSRGKPPAGIPSSTRR
jgi:hypothetical protein